MQRVKWRINTPWDPGTVNNMGHLIHTIFVEQDKRYLTVKYTPLTTDVCRLYL